MTPEQRAARWSGEDTLVVQMKKMFGAFDQGEIKTLPRDEPTKPKKSFLSSMFTSSPEDEMDGIEALIRDITQEEITKQEVEQLLAEYDEHGFILPGKDPTHQLSNQWTLEELMKDLYNNRDQIEGPQPWFSFLLDLGLLEDPPSPSRFEGLDPAKDGTPSYKAVMAEDREAEDPVIVVTLKKLFSAR